MAKALLYNHFASKDDLVVVYLERRSEQMHDSLYGGLADAPKDARVRLGMIFDDIRAMAGAAAFRGCPFINAAAEFPLTDHPVRAAVTRHRQRFAALIAEQLTCGGIEPERALVESVAIGLRRLHGRCTGGFPAGRRASR